MSVFVCVYIIMDFFFKLSSFFVGLIHSRLTLLSAFLQLLCWSQISFTKGIKEEVIKSILPECVWTSGLDVR